MGDVITIALMGNPNVGKSTLFNALTGMRQHTGNWPGKTVARAEGSFSYNGRDYLMVDLPGCYSLMAHSAEEEVARDYILSGAADLIIVVCDATCLERNLNLVLQTLEMTDRVLVCVNLMDEAKRNGISIDLPRLAHRLGVPVIGLTARSKEGPGHILPAIENALKAENTPLRPSYPEPIKDAVNRLTPLISDRDKARRKYIALRLLDGTNCPGNDESSLKKQLESARKVLLEKGIDVQGINDQITASISMLARDICHNTVCRQISSFSRDRRIDKLLTGPLLGFPAMLLLLAGILWLTITGANYPSQLLSSLLFGLQDKLLEICRGTSLPPWLYEMLLLGVYRVLAWVVAVMLPPMAIFFPLFTLLEDLGYLPRVAFNLDRCFKGCRACGKQALTMCMGFGCNAVGVTGCRIIDSPHRRHHQQLCTLQRALPHPHRHNIYVFCIILRGLWGLRDLRPAADRCYTAGHTYDLCSIPSSVRYAAQGRSLILHAGAAPIPSPSGGQGDSALCAGQNRIRAGAGGVRRSSRGPYHMADGKPSIRGRVPPQPLRGFS